MSKATVFIPEMLHPETSTKIREFAEVITDRDGPLEAEYAIVRNYHVDQALLARMPNLRAVIKHGAGLDRINTHLLETQGIKWFHTPGINANGVAELAITQALRLLRHPDLDRGPALPREFSGRKIAILGMGRIGGLVATMAIQGFNASVSAYDPFATAPNTQVHMWDRIDNAVDSAEVLFVTCPLVAETTGLVDRTILEALADRAVVVNTSRAPIVDNQAMIKALERGKIHGYAHDFQGEPDSLENAPENGLLLSTTHIGGATEESLKRTGEAVVHILQTTMEEAEA